MLPVTRSLQSGDREKQPQQHRKTPCLQVCPMFLTAIQGFHVALAEEYITSVLCE